MERSPKPITQLLYVYLHAAPLVSSTVLICQTHSATPSLGMHTRDMMPIWDKKLEILSNKILAHDMEQRLFWCLNSVQGEKSWTTFAPHNSIAMTSLNELQSKQWRNCIESDVNLTIVMGTKGWYHLYVSVREGLALLQFLHLTYLPPPTLDASFEASNSEQSASEFFFSWTQIRAAKILWISHWILLPWQIIIQSEESSDNTRFYSRHCCEASMKTELLIIEILAQLIF